MKNGGAAIVVIVAVSVVLMAAWVWRWWRRPDRRRRPPWFNRPLLPHESAERKLRELCERIVEDSRRTDR